MFGYKRTKIPKNVFICDEEWDSMKGNGNVRECVKCKSKVYDLRGLTEKEVFQFVELENGEVCGQAHYDQAGRIVNGKCTDGVSVVGGKMRITELTIEEKIEESENRLNNLKELKKLKSESEQL